MFEHMDPRFVDHPGWWGFFGGFVPLLLFVILIGVLVWAVLRVTSQSRTATVGPAVPPPPPAPTQDRAVEEVRVQYARGQITREEFVQRMQDLGARPPGDELPGSGG